MLFTEEVGLQLRFLYNLKIKVLNICNWNFPKRRGSWWIAWNELPKHIMEAWNELLCIGADVCEPESRPKGDSLCRPTKCSYFHSKLLKLRMIKLWFVSYAMIEKGTVALIFIRIEAWLSAVFNGKKMMQIWTQILKVWFWYKEKLYHTTHYVLFGHLRFKFHWNWVRDNWVIKKTARFVFLWNTVYIHYIS